jgi:hypothetical protein
MLDAGKAIKILLEKISNRETFVRHLKMQLRWLLFWEVLQMQKPIAMAHSLISK